MFTPAKQTENQPTKPTPANGTFFGGGSLPFFQAKLTVNQPGDAHEQEADRIADQVMRMPAFMPSAGNREGHAPILQRMSLTPVSSVMRACAACEKEKMQRKESGSGDAGGKAAPSMVSDVLSSGSGHPMDGGTRQFMESRFGQDFSQVRVHTDSRAAESASAIQARAYTSGRDVVFGRGEYQPGSESGKRLLAHELAHVGQQGGASMNFIQRDLATPPPTGPVTDQPDLTVQQIQEAIAFNRVRYDGQNTRLIQNMLGGPITGIWSAENIEAIASTQEEYGMPADGKVGPATFRFINNEQRLEGMSRRNRDCLTSLREVSLATPQFVRIPGNNTCDIWGSFRTESQFSSRCTCSDFEYRQFIRGHFRRRRAGVETDISTVFNRIPGGALPANFVEDGDTTDNPVNYGHRNNPADADPEDHYMDNQGNDDQANGCRYRNFDGPEATLNDCQAGDAYDLNMNFRGEIQRNGTPVTTKAWTVFNFRNHIV